MVPDPLSVFNLLSYGFRARLLSYTLASTNHANSSVPCICAQPAFFTTARSCFAASCGTAADRQAGETFLEGVQGVCAASECFLSLLSFVLFWCFCSGVWVLWGPFFPAPSFIQPFLQLVQIYAVRCVGTVALMRSVVHTGHPCTSLSSFTRRFPRHSILFTLQSQTIVIIFDSTATSFQAILIYLSIFAFLSPCSFS